MKGTRRPNFFIVGAAKCGTTSMHEYVVQHPDIFMSTWKEPNFFAQDLNGRADWMLRDLDEYLELFRDATVETYVGESSVGHLYSKEAARRIKEFCPEARIVIMLRDPVDAICSMFHQHVINGTETIFDLKSAIAAEERRAQGDVPKMLPFRYWFQYTDTVRFAAQVERYFDAFGRDAVHVIIFDDFKADPRQEFERLISWLGLPPCETVDFGNRNPARPPRNYLIKRFLLMTPQLTKYLFRINPDIRRKIGDLTSKLSPVRSPVPVIDEETKRQLGARLRSDVDSLERLLGRSLPGWCREERPAEVPVEAQRLKS